MPPIDFERARAFVAAIPDGGWSSYKQVAIAAGSPRGAQAIGQWLRRDGDTIENVHRVLTVDGYVAPGFVAAGANVPDGDVAVRDLLRREGVRIDELGRAAPLQLFTAADWRDGR